MLLKICTTASACAKLRPVSAEISASRLLFGSSISHVEPGENLEFLHESGSGFPLWLLPFKEKLENGEVLEFYLPQLGIHADAIRFRVSTQEEFTVVVFNPQLSLKTPQAVEKYFLGVNGENLQFKFDNFLLVRHLVSK